MNKCTGVRTKPKTLMLISVLIIAMIQNHQVWFIPNYRENGIPNSLINEMRLSTKLFIFNHCVSQLLWVK